MSESSLFHVLQFVRSIRDGKLNKFNETSAMRDVLHLLWGFDADTPEFLRSMASMQDRVVESIAVVSTDDRIDGEGRDGIVRTLEQVKASLAPGNLGTALVSFIPDLSISISQISLIVGLYGLRDSPYREVEDEISSLISELESELERLNSEEFNEVREFARKQIAAIIILLKAIDVFGVDSAYTAYFQLVLGVRRANEGASESKKTTASRIWPSLERWAGRLSTIESAVSKSKSLFIAGKQALLLLGGPTDQ